MDPSQIVHLFANPWTAAVAVLAVVVETMPAEWVAVPDSVRRWVGWLAVAACAPAAVVVGADIAGAMMAGAMGLAGSWLLLEVVEAGSKRRSGQRIPDPDVGVYSAPPGGLPKAQDDEPPPLYPPPPVKVQDDEPPPLYPPPPVK